MNIFETATRQKFRFVSSKGELSVEDLWELPLTSTRGAANLDDIARGLHRQLRNDDNVSFVSGVTKSDPTIQMKFDVVKYVIDTRLEENVAKNQEKERAERKQTLLGLLEEKQNEEMKGLSKEEILAAIAAL